MRDIFEEAAKKAGIPNESREEIIEEMREGYELKLINAFSERMHNRAVAGKRHRLAPFGTETTFVI